MNKKYTFCLNNIVRGLNHKVYLTVKAKNQHHAKSLIRYCLGHVLDEHKLCFEGGGKYAKIE